MTTGEKVERDAVLFFCLFVGVSATLFAILLQLSTEM